MASCVTWESGKLWFHSSRMTMVAVILNYFILVPWDRNKKIHLAPGHSFVYITLEKKTYVFQCLMRHSISTLQWWRERNINKDKIQSFCHKGTNLIAPSYFVTLSFILMTTYTNSLAIFNLKYEKIKPVIIEYKIRFLSYVKIYANVVYLQIILLCFWGMTTGSLYCCDGQSILKI